MSPRGWGNIIQLPAAILRSVKAEVCNSWRNPLKISIKASGLFLKIFSLYIHPNVFCERHFWKLSKPESLVLDGVFFSVIIAAAQKRRVKGCIQMQIIQISISTFTYFSSSIGSNSVLLVANFFPELKK